MRRVVLGIFLSPITTGALLPRENVSCEICVKFVKCERSEALVRALVTPASIASCAASARCVGAAFGCANERL